MKPVLFFCCPSREQPGSGYAGDLKVPNFGEVVGDPTEPSEAPMVRAAVKGGVGVGSSTRTEVPPWEVGKAS